MTDKYVSPTGNDTTGDGTEGNPYLTIDKAFDVLTSTTDDNVILADGDYNQTTNLLNNGGNKTAGTMTLKSSSGDASLCSISGNTTVGNYYLLRAAEASIPLEVQNITFKDHKRTDGGAVFLNSSTALFTFTSCVWDNLTIVGAAVANTGFYRESTNATGLTINGLTVRNCAWSTTLGTGNEGVLWSSQAAGGIGSFSGINVESLTVTNGTAYQVNGLCFYRGANVWTGTNSFAGITMTGGHGSYGIIKFKEGTSATSHTVSGTFTIDNVNQTLTGVNGDNFGYLGVDGLDTLTITADMEIKNCTSITDVGQPDRGFISNLSATATLNISSPNVGEYVKIHDNSITSNGGCIVNAGGPTNVSSVHGYSNTADSGVILVLSLGADTNISGCLLHNNTAVDGGGIHSFPTSGVNTINISNTTIVDNTASGNGDGMFLNELATTTATYNVKNTICRNGGVDEISIGGTGVPVVNIYNSDVEGGDPGADVYTDNIDADALFTNSASNDYSLTSTSPCVGIGLKWWTGANKVDAFGEPFADFSNDIGGLMSTHNPFHPVNL